MKLTCKLFGHKTNLQCLFDYLHEMHLSGQYRNDMMPPKIAAQVENVVCVRCGFVFFRNGVCVNKVLPSFIPASSLEAQRILGKE